MSLTVANRTANPWGLFLDPGWEEAAESLDHIAEGAVRDLDAYLLDGSEPAPALALAFRVGCEELRRYGEFGAADPEGRGELARHLSDRAAVLALDLRVNECGEVFEV